MEERQCTQKCLKENLPVWVHGSSAIMESIRFMRFPERAVHEGVKADMTTYGIANRSWNNSPAESEYLSLVTNHCPNNGPTEHQHDIFAAHFSTAGVLAPRT